MLAVWLGVFAGSASCVFAQTSPDPTLRVPCSDAVIAARGQSVRVSRERGIDAMGGCAHEFGEVIPAIWREASLSTGAMSALVRQSRMVRDARVYGGLLDLARDGSAPLDRRLTALTVLAAYLEPSNGLRVQDLLSGRIGDPMPIINHVSTRDGEVPGSPTDLRKAIELFSDLAAGGSPAEIKRAGRYLRRGFITQYPSLTPVPTGALRGQWDCEGHLVLENVSDTDLPLSLVDADGAKFQDFMLHGAVSAPFPNRLTVQLTKTGPLSVQFGGRNLLHLPCR